MISKEIEKLLILLEKIEKTLSNIYGSFAVNQSFGDEVRRFWATMMEAELDHAALFRNIREKAKHNENVHIQLNFKMDFLRKSYQRIQRLQKIVMESEFSEKKAYTLGANIEEKLYEFSYCKRVTSNNKDLMNGIKKVDDDTKRHYFLLHNYSLDGALPSITNSQ